VLRSVSRSHPSNSALALSATAGCLLLWACSPRAGSQHAADLVSPSPDAARHAADSGPASIEQARPTFCERRGQATQLDALFCGAGAAPRITSLRDLQRELDLVPFARTELGDGLSRTNSVVMLGLSTALPGHLVSPLNPRAIILGRYTTLAYVRGAQEVELASVAPGDTAEPVFYLLRYQQRCNGTPDGCSSGDLFTPATESDWTDVTIQDDEELENTPSDCRACHARAGARAQLLMREVDGPWTHYFDSQAPERATARPELTGYDLLQDYMAAKGDERYAEIDATQLAPSTAQGLEVSVGLDQPLYFDSLGIERERWPMRDGAYPSEPQASPTWDAAYAAFKRGEQLAIPHFDPRPTDPSKQARLRDAYARYRDRELDPEDLPDLSDIFPDDPSTRAQLGLQVEPGATPAESLIQACGPCHNDALDQRLSRARFNIDLGRMSAAELDVAVERIALPPSAAGAMPPPRARALTDETRQQLAQYLLDVARGNPVDPELARAANAGFMGGRRPRR
jgi:cytochrome c553